ncbi:MAG: DUF4296 domain-containing protein [Prevotellaceae bacterium]|nr:DUF4296 domain-containing protein [Candidatus Minthosoma equi]
MKKILPIIILSLLFAFSCSKNPDGILSTGKMEDVLYDYHIAQGLIDQLPVEEREKKSQEYIDAVFEKHGVTEAEFDSSIIYYNRHSKDLHKIYSNIKDRLTEVSEEMKVTNGNNDLMAIFAEGGDTTNLWNKDNLIVLRDKEILNHESFLFNADSSYRKNDQFTLSFSSLFVKEQNDERDVQLCAGLILYFKDGKSIAQTRQINYNGQQQISVKAIEGQDISKVGGFFYYSGKTATRNICFIDGISLIRMHEKDSEPAVTVDTVKVDSIAKDTLNLPAKRLSPEEIRNMNKSNEQIKIQVAPTVRTPNSIGPRRKPSNQRKR